MKGLSQLLRAGEMTHQVTTLVLLQGTRVQIPVPNQPAHNYLCGSFRVSAPLF